MALKITSVGNQKTPANSKESWGGYAKRNIAKIPLSLYELGRSGLGTGDYLEYAERKHQGWKKNIEERDPLAGAIRDRTSLYPKTPMMKQSMESVPTLRKALLPSMHEANQEAESIASVFTNDPKYYSEHRPEDWPVEAGLQALPWIIGGGIGAAKAGTNIATGLGKAGLKQLGLFGGSHAGRAIGGSLGEAVGDREGGELLGAPIGGILGYKGTSKAMNQFENRPSKTISPKVAHAEESIINTPTKEIEAYNKRIKQLEKDRAPLYKKAQSLEGNAKGNPAKIGEAINEVTKELTLGVDPADATRISKILAPLEAEVAHGSIPLKDVKKYQKNYNDQIYDRSASNSFKRIMHGVVDALNEFIEDTGSEEHTQTWQQAEAAHREFSELKKGRKEFISEKKAEAKHLKQNQQATTNTFENLVKDFAKSKYGSAFGLGGLGYALKSMFGYKIAVPVSLGLHGAKWLVNEMKIARDAFKNHPEIYAEYKNLVHDIPHINKAQLISTITQLDRQLKDATRNDKKSNQKKNGKFKITARH